MIVCNSTPLKTSWVSHVRSLKVSKKAKNNFHHCFSFHCNRFDTCSKPIEGKQKRQLKEFVLLLLSKTKNVHLNVF